MHNISTAMFPGKHGLASFPHESDTALVIGLSVLVSFLTQSSSAVHSCLVDGDGDERIAFNVTLQRQL